MKTQGKIVILILLTITMGQAKEDLELMKEMITEIKMDMNNKITILSEQLAVSEEKQVKTDAKLEATKEDLATTKDDLTEALADLTITKRDLVNAKADLISKTDEMVRDMAILRNPPFMHVCGSHYDSQQSLEHQTISFTSLLYFSTNTEGGGLDIGTGVFTAPTGGSYTVSWDTSALVDHGQNVGIFLQKNGETILESQHNSYYSGPSGGVCDQGQFYCHILNFTLTLGQEFSH